MAIKYDVYKGLQKPLQYKGFKGKFIYWGLGFLLLGLVAGAITMTVISKWFGAIVLVGCIVGGLLYTGSSQKRGLHTKKRHNAIYVHKSILILLNKYEKEERI